MDPASFTNSPGSVDDYDGLPCYRPPSLPPDLAYSDDLLRVYGDAQYALGRLTALHRDLDNPNLLIAPFVHREAAMSSQVEGTNVTISDIYQHEVGAAPKRSAAEETDVREAYNYVDAVTEGFARLDAGDELDVALVRDLHGQLLSGTRGDEAHPGELRDVPVFIGAPDADPADATFIPAGPDLVPVLLEQLFADLRRGDALELPGLGLDVDFGRVDPEQPDPLGRPVGVANVDGVAVDHLGDGDVVRSVATPACGS